MAFVGKTPNHDTIFSMKKAGARLCLGIILLLLLALTLPTLAQGALTLRLYDPELTQFPKVILYLDAYDQVGGFISDLNLRNFRLFEDDKERIVNEAVLTQPGLETIIALNLGATLSNKSQAGSTRFDDIYAALINWLNAIPASPATDLYSLVSNEGRLAEKETARGAFMLTLQGYHPNLFNLQPNMDSLDTAVNLAVKPNPNPHGKQAIFYITALPLESQLGRLPSLGMRAARLNVPVFVWLVAPATSLNSSAANALKRLATTTGGQFFLFSESVQAPSPEVYLGPLRSTYRLRYTSAIHESGEHNVTVQVQRGDQQTSTPPLNFRVTLSPPLPSLLGLPGEITRRWIQDASGNLSLQPDFLTLQMKVSFPDGYPRQLKAARLLVDDQVVLENTLPPFEYFAWVLDAYRASGSHILKVEVEDILGYRSQGLESVIQIDVLPRVMGPWGQVLEFLSQGGWLIPAGLLLAGAGYLAYRNRARLLARLESQRKLVEVENLDPLTQPVPLIEEAGGTELGEPDSSVATGENSSQISSARLEWASGKPPLASVATIRLDQPEITIGRNPKFCSLVLKVPGVEKLHAVIIVAKDGQVTIANRSRKGGTWVNYAPISPRGVILQPGDLVRMGKAEYRFEVGYRSRIAAELNKI